MQSANTSPKAQSITIKCPVTAVKFTVAEAELELLRRIPELNPVLGTSPLPLPKIHPWEEVRRIMSSGALVHLYKSKSVVSGQPQLTRFDPRLGYKICTNAEFAAADVDNIGIGGAYDFNASLPEQFSKLFDSAILPPLNQLNCEESEYSNAAIDLNRSFLCFAAFRSTDCLYCFNIEGCTDCLYCICCRNCELCYASSDLVNCYAVQDSKDCQDSQELFGCLDCRSCSHCYGCVGLERKTYCVFNKQVTKLEYDAWITAQILRDAEVRQRCVAECRSFAIELGYTVNSVRSCTNATGAYLSRCEDMVDCHNGFESTNCGYLWKAERSHYCYRGLGSNAQFGYCAAQFGSQLSIYSNNIFGGEANIYSMYLYNCSHCFGCLALKNKSYCILNQQYSKSEYLELVPRIIAHMTSTTQWGEWFPLSVSPHLYHDSSSHEFMEQIPLETARQRGYRFQEFEDSETPQTSLPVLDAPVSLTPETLREILSNSYRCSVSGKLYIYQQAELEFYLRQNIPPPERHWNIVLNDLIGQRTLIQAV